jgi:hypothetical protein
MLKEQYQKQVEQEVNSFRKGAKKIEESPNPSYADPEVREFEVGQLKDAMEKRVDELNREFHAKIDHAIEQQHQAAARSSVFVSSADKTRISENLRDLHAALAFATSDSDKALAFDKFSDKLDAFEDSGLGPMFELKRQMPELLHKLGDDAYSKRKLQSMYGELAKLKTEEEEALKELKDQKLAGVTYKYKLLQMTHPVYKHKQAARRSGSI